MKNKPNPELYRKMLEPFANQQDYSAAVKGFFEELLALREKYHLANVCTITAAQVMEGENEVTALRSIMIGDSAHEIPMLAAAYNARMDELDAKLRSPARAKTE